MHSPTRKEEKHKTQDANRNRQHASVRRTREQLRELRQMTRLEMMKIDALAYRSCALSPSLPLSLRRGDSCAALLGLILSLMSTCGWRTRNSWIHSTSLLREPIRSTLCSFTLARL